MQSFAFFVCFTFCILLLLPCKSQSSATPLYRGNFVRAGNERRCDWQCVVVDSDFGKDMKKLITEYKLITLDLAFEQRVDDKCLNQTYLYNATKPADIWTWQANNNQSRGENVSKLPGDVTDGGSVTWFRKSFEGQINVTVLCHFRPAASDAPLASNSLNDLIALLLLTSVENCTGGLSSSETILCYKESAKNGPYACLDATTNKASNPFPSQSWTEDALMIVAILIAVILTLYSPIILCLFSPTEVNTERRDCVIVLGGASPVGIRSFISNFFSSKDNGLLGVTGLFSFISTFIASFNAEIVLGLLPLFTVTFAHTVFGLVYFIFIFYGITVLIYSRFGLIIFKSKLAIRCTCECLRCKLSGLIFGQNKLSIRSECLTCKLSGEANKTSHHGLLEELKQHLRLQPSIVMKSCTDYFESLNLICHLVKKKLTFESACLNCIFLVCLAPFIVVALLIALAIFPIRITLSIIFSCPLSTFFPVIVLPDKYRPAATTTATWNLVTNSPRRIPRFVIMSTLGFLQFSPLVGSVAFLGFQIIILSLKVIGRIVMRLPGYLPVATLVVIVAFYCWRCYSSFTRKYHSLAITLYKHYTANTQGGEDQQVNSREDIVPEIPKDLFEKACNELMPLRESIIILVVKLISLLTFFFVVFAVIMETPGANDQAKATTTFFTALVPKIIEMVFSKDPRVEKLDDEVLDKKVKSIVDEYLSRTENSSNGGDTSLENSSNSIYESVENERTELLNDNQIDVQDYRTFGRSRNTDEASSG